MFHKYLIPTALLLAACTNMAGDGDLSVPPGADGSVFNSEDEADYKPGGDPLLRTGGGLNDEDD